MTTVNRNKLKQLFITFPKSNITKEAFKDHLVAMQPTLSYYFVAEETHADGTPHFHAIMKLSSGMSKSNVLTYLKTTFPDDYKRIDVQSVRSMDQSVTYLSKEDPSPLVYGRYKAPHKFKPKEWHREAARQCNILDLDAYLLNHLEELRRESGGGGVAELPEDLQ